MVVYCDSKHLEDITGNEAVDHLPLAISGSGFSQLIGAPKLNHGVCKKQQMHFIKLLTDWQLTDKVKEICFDTTASNTGHKSSACVLIVQKLEKGLLWFSCRHHTAEIILEAVVSPTLQASSGPDIMIFHYLNNFSPIGKI